MLAYLIGPSGVGKSELAKRASKVCSTVFYIDLDALMQSRDSALFSHDGSKWQEFWDLGATCFQELETTHLGSLCLVDCGAGCLKTREALSYFRARQEVILIHDLPQNAFNRARVRPGGYWSTRSLAEYVGEEYSAERRQFYEAAKYKVDVTDLDKEEAAAKFICFIEDLKANSLPQPNIDV